MGLTPVHGCDSCHIDVDTDSPESCLCEKDCERQTHVA